MFHSKIISGIELSEIFSRVKINSLVALVLDDSEFPVSDDLKIQTLKSSANSTNSTARKTTKKKIKTSTQTERAVNDEGKFHKGIAIIDPTLKPYLLLDVRDEDEYRKCHIVTAKNYPYVLLSRAYHYESDDLKAYRNQPGKIIIVYDENEALATRVATTLIQRGYENMYLLTGGMSTAYRLYSTALFTGVVPSRIVDQVEPVGKMNRSASILSSRTLPKKPRARSKQKASKTTFSRAELVVLHDQLVENLIPDYLHVLNRIGKDTESSKTRVAAGRQSRSTEKVPFWMDPALMRQAMV